MKKALFVLAGLAGLGGMGYFGTWVSAQNQNNQNEVKPAVATDQPTSKIGVVNMIKVLKGFDKANYLGEILIKQAQAEEENLKNEANRLAGEKERIKNIADKSQKDLAERAFTDKEYQFQKNTMDLRKKYADKQSEMALEVHDNITKVIDVLAKTKGLELILSYPDRASEKDPITPAHAFQFLAPQAANVAWRHPGLDITEAVIQTLNFNFKRPAGTVPPTGSSMLPTPGAGAPPRP